MSDSLIHDTPSQANAVFGYGERQKRRVVLSIVIGFACLMVIAAIALGVIVRQSLVLPERISWLVYARSARFRPAGFFPSWDSFQQQSIAGPMFGGMARDGDGREYPFFVHPHFPWDGKLWKLETPNTLIKTRSVPLQDLHFSWKNWLNTAWLRVWPASLITASSTSVDVASALSGPLTSTSWKTDESVDLAEVVDTPAIVGPNMLNLQALPKTWPFVEEILKQQGVDTSLIEIPSQFMWDASSSTNLMIALEFNQPASTSTILAVAAAAQLFDRSLWTLPDETIAQELRLPERLLATSGTSLAWLHDGGRRLVLDGAAWNPITVHIPSSCQGRVVALLDATTFERVLPMDAFFLQIIHHFDIKQFLFSVKDGKLNVCW